MIVRIRVGAVVLVALACSVLTLEGQEACEPSNPAAGERLLVHECFEEGRVRRFSIFVDDLSATEGRALIDFRTPVLAQEITSAANDLFEREAKNYYVKRIPPNHRFTSHRTSVSRVILSSDTRRDGIRVRLPFEIRAHHDQKKLRVIGHYGPIPKLCWCWTRRATNRLLVDGSVSGRLTLVDVNEAITAAIQLDTIDAEGKVRPFRGPFTRSIDRVGLMPLINTLPAGVDVEELNVLDVSEQLVILEIHLDLTGALLLSGGN